MLVLLLRKLHVAITMPRKKATKAPETSVLSLEEKLITQYRVKPYEAELLRNLSREIAKTTGVAVNEAKLIGFLIQQGVPRTRISKEGLLLD